MTRRVGKSDIPALLPYASRRLQNYLQLRLQAEALNGDGTGEHLLGLDHFPGHTVAAQGGDTLGTALFKLVRKVFDRSGVVPNWAAVNSQTWADLFTPVGSSGEYTAGAMSLASVRLAWGLNLIVTPTVPTDRIYVGNSAYGTLFVSGGFRTEASTGFDQYYGEGLCAVRGVVKAALVIERPEAFGVEVIGS